MDYSSEIRFVKSFVRKNRQERLLYELTTPKKRYDGISRFCHHAKELLDPDRLLLEGKDMDRTAAFEKFVGEHSGTCLLLSPDAALDQNHLPLKAACDKAAMCLDAVLILGDNFALVFGEPEKGGREKYLSFL